MLFIQASFLFGFLPIVLAGFILLLKTPWPRAALAWLGLASVLFYIWADVRLLALLMFSIWTNFSFGKLIFRTRARFWVAAGVLFNVVLLAIFKYADFVAVTVNRLAGTGIPLPHIALPLGISFFTFTQIAWLVDMRTKPKRPRAWDYLLFVTFFPHLVAGPILHHAEMMPQFEKITQTGKRLFLSRFRFHFAIGMTIFVFGLFKKVVIADGCGALAAPGFDAASSGKPIGTIEAWSTVLSYTMQIYFDFSGYSDMAVGLARMFGIRLPINFFSPYQATSIVEFWRRWHMTLSRWLKDYIYVPLGGNRKGPPRRYINLMATMLIGGLWHGAAWTFVLWGGLHGLYLAANHAWSKTGRKLGWTGWCLTFFAVVNAWVLFRSGSYDNDFATAANMFSAMYSLRASPPNDLSILWFSMIVALLLPNSYEVMHRYRPVLESISSRTTSLAAKLPILASAGEWRPSVSWSFTVAILTIASIYTVSRADSYVEFIYFQF